MKTVYRESIHPIANKKNQPKTLEELAKESHRLDFKQKNPVIKAKKETPLYMLAGGMLAITFFLLGLLINYL